MTKITDEQIRAWADGELSVEPSAAIDILILNDPEIAAKAASFEASKLPYKSAMEADIPPVPDELRDQLAQWSQIAEGSSRRISFERGASHYWVSAVAAVMLLSVILWASIAFFKPHHPTRGWAEAIVSYQNFYVSETVSHITGDTAAASLELASLQQLSTDFPSSAPDLTGQGYAYKRLQRLDFSNQPVLQMVFYKVGKRPLAICLMPDDAKIQAQFTQHELLNSYVWQSGKLRAIVVAEEDSAVLEGIAELVGI